MELLALLGNGDLTLSIDDGTECGDVIGGSHEVIGVAVRQSAATDGGDAVLDLALVGDNAAAADDADAIGSGIPGTDNDLLGAAHLTHQLAADEGTAVIGQDVDDLAVLQQGDQLTEDSLMSQSNSSDNDDASALDSLSHIIGGQSNLCGALTLIAKEAELSASQGDAGLFDVGEVDLREFGRIPQANFLALQSTVSSHRLADGASTQNRDGHVLQITHIHSSVLL